MKLHQVEILEAGMLETFMHSPFDVVGRKSIVEREFAPAGPGFILRRNLRSGVKLLLRIRAHQLAQQCLAASFAIGPGRVEEIAS